MQKSLFQIQHKFTFQKEQINQLCRVQCIQYQLNLKYGVKSNMTEKMFFGAGSGQIAQILGNQSSIYIYFSALDSNQLLVQSVSSSKTPIGSVIKINEAGYVCI
ncbi:hypothetical protein ABPG72_000375 [Tetrahymena utriculariae]